MVTEPCAKEREVEPTASPFVIIRDWFHVSVSECRFDERTNLTQQLDADETEGWDDLTAWRTTRQNLAVTHAALAYDEASHQLAV